MADNKNLPQSIQDNLITFLEISRRALADGDIFDDMANELDISDEELLKLREDLNEFLDSE